MRGRAIQQKNEQFGQAAEADKARKNNFKLTSWISKKGFPKDEDIDRGGLRSTSALFAATSRIFMPRWRGS